MLPGISDCAVVRNTSGRGSTSRRKRNARRPCAKPKNLAKTTRDWRRHGTTLGVIENAMGRSTEAERHFLGALSIWEKILPPDDPNLAAVWNNLGEIYLSMGRNGKARPALERAIAIYEKAGNPDDVRLAPVLSTLGVLTKSEGRVRRGGTIAPAVPRHPAPSVWAESPERGSRLTVLGELRVAQRRYQEAEILYKERVGDRGEIARAGPSFTGGDAPRSGGTPTRAGSLRRSGDPGDPRYPDLRRRIAGRQSAAGGRAQSHGSAQARRGGVRGIGRASAQIAIDPRKTRFRWRRGHHGDSDEPGRHDHEAGAVCRRRIRAAAGARAVRRATRSLAVSTCRRFLNNLGVALQGQGRWKESEALLRRALESAEKLDGRTHVRISALLENLAVSLDRQGKFEEVRADSFCAPRDAQRHPDRMTPKWPRPRCAGPSLFFARSIRESRRALAPGHRDVEKTLGPGRSESRHNLRNFADYLGDRNRLAAAEAVIREPGRFLKTKLGPDTLPVAAVQESFRGH